MSARLFEAPPAFRGLAVKGRDEWAIEGYTGRPFYHRPSCPPTFVERLTARLRRPALEFQRVACAPAHRLQEARPGPRVSASGDTLERWATVGWEPFCRVAFHQGDYWLAPLPVSETYRRLRLNGIILDERQASVVSSGDILDSPDEWVCRTLVEGRPSQPSILTQAESFAEALMAGVLTVYEDADGRRHGRLLDLFWPAAHFFRTALAPTLASVEVVPGDKPQFPPTESYVNSIAASAGEFLPRLRFVLPTPLDLPPSVAFRLARPVDLRLDGEPLEGARLHLVKGPGGALTPTRLFAQAPLLVRSARGAFLSCEEGAGALDCVTRRGLPMSLVPAAQYDFNLPLLPGDEWVLRSGQAEVVLSVHEQSASHRARPPPGAAQLPQPQPEPLIFEGQELRSITLHYVRGQVGDQWHQWDERDVTLTQDRAGVFRGAIEAAYGVVQGGGFLKCLGSRCDPFTLYQPADTRRSPPEPLVLPSPSAFLRGRVRLPEGPLSPERLAVFVDELLEQGDGAALAFSRLLSANSDRARAQWLSRLLVMNDELARSLSVASEWPDTDLAPLVNFERRLMATDDRRASLLIHAVNAEPMLSHVEEIHVVDTLGGAWLPSLLHWEDQGLSVRLVRWHGGNIVNQFEPRPGSDAWRQREIPPGFAGRALHAVPLALIAAS